MPHRFNILGLLLLVPISVPLILHAGPVRPLTELELKTIIGGGIKACDWGKMPGGSTPSWKCSDTGSFSCKNLCDRCAQGTNKCSLQCAGYTCWNCALNNLLRECLYTGKSSDTCWEMGDGQNMCGVWYWNACNYDAATKECACTATYPMDAQCDRFNCRP
jgi:hypothetical protein